MSDFLDKLDAFIREVERMPKFKGQTQALAGLKRVQGFSVFTRGTRS